MSKIKDAPEERKTVLNVTVSKEPAQPNVTEYFLEIFEKYLDFVKLQRVVAFCLRFFNYSSAKKQEKFTGSLKVKELQNSLFIIIKIIPKKYFYIYRNIFILYRKLKY